MVALTVLEKTVGDSLLPIPEKHRRPDSSWRDPREAIEAASIRDPRPGGGPSLHPPAGRILAPPREPDAAEIAGTLATSSGVLNIPPRRRPKSLRYSDHNQT